MTVDQHPLRVDRAVWINTFAGMLDAAFRLTDEEQFQVAKILRDLFIALRIPERGDPVALPASLALEQSAAVYTQQLCSRRVSGRVLPVHHALPSEVRVDVETWRAALLKMITYAYPDLMPVEKLAAGAALTQLLAAIGVPERAIMCMPQEVMNSYLRGEY